MTNIDIVACCIFALLVALGNASTMLTTEPYSHSVTLSEGNIRVHWKFNETHITFEVFGNTKGWVGIGFSPNGAMTGADIFIGWVKNGEVLVKDRHGVANAFPPLDPQQDINVIEGSECDGWTMFKFSRQLAACEADYDREITQNTQRFIWAWGEEDPSGDDIDQGHYHGTKRGVKSMFFLQSERKPTVLPEGPVYKTLDIRMNDFVIPAEGTYYNCKLYRLPKFTKKHHIVKFEPIIQEGNKLNVHHIIVKWCGNMLQDPSELERDANCWPKIPEIKHFATCTKVIAVWAIGAGSTTYPEEAGFSIGGEGDPIYVQLQVHYDNPTAKSGIIDSSGFRFTYTDELRKYDMGVIEIGARANQVEHIIPPGADDFLSVGHCTSDCLGNRMAASGVEEINVFNILLHSHLAGTSLRLRQIRDEVELPHPAYDDHYDFNYQELRYLHPHLILKPNDNLRMECVYNTKDRKRVTVGGLGTPQEMCLAFLYYYPRIDLGYCLSSVPKKSSWRFLGIDSDTAELIPGSNPLWLEAWKLPRIETSKTMVDHFSEFDWTPEKIKSFEAYYNSLEHFEICKPTNASAQTITPFNVTTIRSPYIGLRKICNEPSSPSSQKSPALECPVPTESEPMTTSTMFSTTSAATAMTTTSIPIVLATLHFLVR